MNQKENNKKRAQIHIFLTPEQKKALEKKAKELGIPVSTYIKIKVFM